MPLYYNYAKLSYSQRQGDEDNEGNVQILVDAVNSAKLYLFSMLMLCSNIFLRSSLSSSLLKVSSFNSVY